MKNLHVLHSTKPSKLGLIYESNSYHIFTNGENPHDICDNLAVYKNIYITSEEDIKRGDWYLDTSMKTTSFAVIKCDSERLETIANQFKNLVKKIILTTDKNLTDGNVQPISEEFLQWFIKNSDCEFVETERLEDGRYVNFLPNGDTEEGVYENYKIIIPKEEWISPMQKFKLREEIYTETQQKSLEFNKSLVKFITTEELDLLMSKFDNIEPKQREMFLMNANTVIDTRKPKQETLEKVAKSKAFEFKVDYKPFEIDLDYKEYAEYGFEKGFIEGAKWQQERSYSEEEVITLINKLCYDLGENNNKGIEWFENFKKKNDR